MQNVHGPQLVIGKFNLLRTKYIAAVDRNDISVFCGIAVLAFLSRLIIKLTFFLSSFITLLTAAIREVKMVREKRY